MLSPEDIGKFHEQGYLVCSTGLSAGAMDRARRSCEEALRAPGYCNQPTVHRHLDAAAVHGLCTLDAVLDGVAAILGPDLLLWHSRFFDKAPGAMAIPWHQDMSFWPIDPDLCVSAWIAIDRSDRTNGCMEVIPGSHRRRVPHVASVQTGRFTQHADPEHFDTAGKATIELDPGQFLLFDRWLLHSSPPNRSERRRLGLSARYVPTEVKVSVEIMSPSFPELAPQLVRGQDRFGHNRLTRAPAPIVPA